MFSFALRVKRTPPRCPLGLADALQTRGSEFDQPDRATLPFWCATSVARLWIMCSATAAGT
jgi:hypothetical protein